MKSVSLNRAALAAVLGYSLLLAYITLAPHPWWLFGSAGSEAEIATDAAVPGFIQHCLAYAVLGVLVTWAFYSTRWPVKFACILLASLHAAGTEWLQTFIPPRTCDLVDGVGNITGLVVGWAAAAALIWFTMAACQGNPGDARSGSREGELEDALR